MADITRFDPFRDFWPELGARWPKGLRLPEGSGPEIKLDVHETDKAYEVKAEIPGAKKEDIHVHVDGSYVSISAERREQREKKEGERVLLREMVQGSVSRGFSLPLAIDEREVQAKLEDGVLRLTLPKRSGGASRRIDIQ